MALFGRRGVDARVTALTWTRVVQLEQQQWVRRRTNTRPSQATARNVKRHKETYWAAPNAPAGFAANGSSGRKVLKSRVYYTYEALEWRASRALQASGASGSAWPELVLEPGERVREHRETYTVIVASSDKTRQATLSEQEWRALEVGGICRLDLGALGGIKRVAPVTRRG